MAHYDWTDYYDVISTGIDHDIEFYTELAKNVNGPVLDLGCGTGRFSIPMAMQGIEVVGLDSSEKMLAKARVKSELTRVTGRVTLVKADMRSFEFERLFPLIMIPYRSFLHLLTLKDQIAALKQIRKHLTTDGLLALNVFVPFVKHLYEQDEKNSTRGIYSIPGSEDRLIVWDYTRYDHFQQIAEVIRQYERTNKSGELIQRVVAPFHVRYIFPAELHHLLKLAGFSVIARYGDFKKAAFGPESTELIIVAKKE